jgi:hypothetical protein
MAHPQGWGKGALFSPIGSPLRPGVPLIVLAPQRIEVSMAAFMPVGLRANRFTPLRGFLLLRDNTLALKPFFSLFRSGF